MKEQFDSRLLSGPLNVTCKYDDGSKRMWSTRKEIVIQNIVNVVNEFGKLGYKLTLRQLHYQLVGKNQIVNHITAYKKLGTILDDCRYGGVIDWAAIEDRGRVPKLPYYALDPEDAINDIIGSYRIDRQQGQRVAIEVWTEKDALSGILARATNTYHVRLCVNKGYTSSSAIYEAYNRFAQSMIHEDQKVVILYLGDHDPSGLDMVRDIHERLDMMMSKGRFSDVYNSDQLEVQHLCVTKTQIRQYKLPPNPAKLTDTRAAAYIKDHGMESWEVDALRPEVLDKLVRDAIVDIIDMDDYNATLKQEKIDIKKLKAIDFDNIHIDDDEEDD